jgi:hypothetical protein
MHYSLEAELLTPLDEISSDPPDLKFFLPALTSVRCVSR